MLFMFSKLTLKDTSAFILLVELNGTSWCVLFDFVNYTSMPQVNALPYLYPKFT